MSEDKKEEGSGFAMEQLKEFTKQTEKDIADAKKGNVNPQIFAPNNDQNKK